jgi:hypothetical protein
MPTAGDTEEQIRKTFEGAWKDYVAHERTLDALAAIAFVLKNIKEIQRETIEYDFRPRLAPPDPNQDPYTPDGLIRQRPSYSFLLELKAPWNKSDLTQIVKYAASPGYLKRDKNVERLAENHCILLGYQNIPGDADLDILFDRWREEKFSFPLVVFRYAIEQASVGDRIAFARIPYARNGLCPGSCLGKAFNQARGVQVSVASTKFERSRFHKANDQALPSYAAVLWWQTYTIHYLSEEQRVEMAATGRLSTPLVIPADRLDRVPNLADVDVPLSPRDIKRALEFLFQAGLVAYRTRKNSFEVKLKDDRHIRSPLGGALGEMAGRQDIATKILKRWAVNRVRHPD